jgi:hypothetical protein
MADAVISQEPYPSLPQLALVQGGNAVLDLASETGRLYLASKGSAGSIR